MCRISVCVMAMLLLSISCKEGNKTESAPERPQVTPKGLLDKEGLCSLFCREAAKCKVLRPGVACKPDCNKMLAIRHNREIFRKSTRQFQKSCKALKLAIGLFPFVVRGPYLLVRLPSRLAKPRRGISLRVTRSNLVVEGKPVVVHTKFKIDPVYRQGNPNSFLIQPLRERMSAQKAKFRGKPVVASIMLHPKVPGTMLIYIVYTLYQAGIRHLDFVIETAAGLGALRMDPPPNNGLERVGIEIGKTGLKLTSGKSSKSIANKKAGRGDNLTGLYRALVAHKKANPKIRTLALRVDSGLPWHRLASVWAAAQFNRGPGPFANSKALLAAPILSTGWLFDSVMFVIVE